MPSKKILEAKQAAVAALAEKLKNAASGVLVKYEGITVEDDTAMRKALREAGVEYSVIKNSITGRACEDLQIAFFLAMKGKIAYLPDVTLHYSQGEETVSSSHDERKQFRFDRRVTMLSHELSERYQIKGPAITRFFSQRAFTLLMHAFRAHDAALRHEALACCELWGARPTPAFTVVKAVTSHDVLWRLALRLREKLR